MHIIKFLCTTSSKTLPKFTGIIEYSVKLVKIKVFLHPNMRSQFKITSISQILLTFLISHTCPIVLVLHALISLHCLKGANNCSYSHRCEKITHRVLNTHAYYLLQYTIDTGVII